MLSALRPSESAEICPRLPILVHGESHGEEPGHASLTPLVPQQCRSRTGIDRLGLYVHLAVHTEHAVEVSLDTAGLANCHGSMSLGFSSDDYSPTCDCPQLTRSPLLCNNTSRLDSS